MAAAWFRDVQHPDQPRLIVTLLQNVSAILLQDKYFPIKTVSAQFVFLSEGLWVPSLLLLACCVQSLLSAAPSSRVPPADVSAGCLRCACRAVPALPTAFGLGTTRALLAVDLGTAFIT